MSMKLVMRCDVLPCNRVSKGFIDAYDHAGLWEHAKALGWRKIRMPSLPGGSPRPFGHACPKCVEDRRILRGRTLILVETEGGKRAAKRAATAAL